MVPNIFLFSYATDVHINSSVGVIFDVEVLKDCVRSNIGDVTFQDAYNRTRRILYVVCCHCFSFIII